ncbi:MAG: type I restriction enzyme HsdR N-terminal domain-containing protein [Prevotella sp.]|nr:type I restriction enzyme HsdR N-terminal domain-containing protein [Prevotella sp.]
MTTLNLPPYPVRLAGTRERPTIFDVLRRRYVALTPEEWVRQHFVHFLISEKHYPQTLLANEVRLQVGGKTLRADTVLYDRDLQPRMIIEYKAPTVALTQRVFEQISAYNLLLHVDYLVVSNGLQHYCCRMNYDSRTYEFLAELPAYEEM